MKSYVSLSIEGEMGHARKINGIQNLMKWIQIKEVDNRLPQLEKK